MSDEIYSKYADFIVNFENNHPAYFNNNKLQLKSISIVDDIRERGQLAAGIYYPDTQSIRINRKDIGKNFPRLVIKKFEWKTCIGDGNAAHTALYCVLICRPAHLAAERVYLPDKMTL